MLIHHSCPECGASAEETDRFVLDSTDGPIEHVALGCPRNHQFQMPVDKLSSSLPGDAASRGINRSARRLRILLLCSGFNGLSQRVWVELREAGHHVETQLAGDPDAVRAAVEALDPDLVICPFLKERIPVEVWSSRPTIVLHPGPRGDRGPSSLDWAVMDAEPTWGVTALQAIEEMDAGPIWGSRSFPMPDCPSRKSDLYNGPVTEAALELVQEVAAKAADPTFAPEPLDYRRPEVTGRLRRPVRRVDRSFGWSDPTDHILRRIRAADGSPGVQTLLLGQPVAVFDAHTSRPGTEHPSDPRTEPGTVTRRRHGAVEIATGDGAIWVGHLRPMHDDSPQLKLPATTVLGELLDGVPEAPDDGGYREIDYRRQGRAGEVGVLTFDFYNGAMSTAQCRRLETAVRYAAAQDTRVLVLRGGTTFSNGIHLGVIEAAADPAAQAWANITAIDDVCRQIITCTGQLVVTAISGNAGAGGVMLGLGADRVIARHGVRAQPALPHDGPVRLGVLDLRAATAGRYAGGRRVDDPLRPDRGRGGAAHRACRRGRAGPSRVRRRGGQVCTAARAFPQPSRAAREQAQGTGRRRAPTATRGVPARRADPDVARPDPQRARLRRSPPRLPTQAPGTEHQLCARLTPPTRARPGVGMPARGQPHRAFHATR